MWQKIVHWFTTSIHENYTLRTWGEHVGHINWFLFWHSKQFMYTTCSELVVFMYWTGKSMNNLLSHCGLVDVRINASEKDLPVHVNYVSQPFPESMPSSVMKKLFFKSWNHLNAFIVRPPSEDYNLQRHTDRVHLKL